MFSSFVFFLLATRYDCMTAGGYFGNKGAFLFYFFKGIDLLSWALSSTNAILLFTVGNGVNLTIFFLGFVLKANFFLAVLVFSHFFVLFDLNVKSYPTVNPTVSCRIWHPGPGQLATG